MPEYGSLWPSIWRQGLLSLFQVPYLLTYPFFSISFSRNVLFFFKCGSWVCTTPRSYGRVHQYTGAEPLCPARIVVESSSPAYHGVHIEDISLEPV